MPRREDGFTLVETLAALILLALAASAYYRALEVGTRGAHLAERDASALTIAQNRLDEAIAIGPRPELTRSGVTPEGMSWTTTFSDVQSTQTESSTPIRLKRIDVRVSWRDSPGRPPRDLTLTTLMAAGAP